MPKFCGEGSRVRMTRKARVIAREPMFCSTVHTVPGTQGRLALYPR